MSEVIPENVSRNWMTRYGLAYFGSCVGWAALPNCCLATN